MSLQLSEDFFFNIFMYQRVKFSESMRSSQKLCVYNFDYLRLLFFFNDGSTKNYVAHSTIDRINTNGKKADELFGFWKFCL